ncbi:AbgT family transporter, partial [Microbacterium sp. LB16]
MTRKTEKTLDQLPAGGKGFLNWIEKVGNKVPDPTIMFVYLIALIAVLSALLSWAG